MSNMLQQKSQLEVKKWKEQEEGRGRDAAVGE